MAKDKPAHEIRLGAVKATRHSLALRQRQRFPSMQSDKQESATTTRQESDELRLVSRGRRQRFLGARMSHDVPATLDCRRDRSTPHSLRR